MLPVGVGLVQGEHLWLIGLLPAPAAAVLVSAGHGAGSVRPSRRAVAGPRRRAAIALQLSFLHQAPSDSGVDPLVVGRAVSSAVTPAAADRMFRRLGSEKPPYAMSATVGVLDSVANLLFLLAARSGDLAVVAVITAPYPAGTVLLACWARGVPQEACHAPNDPVRRDQLRPRDFSEPETIGVAHERCSEVVPRAQQIVSHCPGRPVICSGLGRCRTPRTERIVAPFTDCISRRRVP
jgi:hypothetical protein